MISVLAAFSTQAQNPPDSFEVASVKPNKSGVWTATSNGNDRRLAWGNATLMSTISYAYKVLPYQVRGPAWLDSERYDIQAIKPPAATDDQVRIMLQNLLAERFELRVHHEYTETPVYALRVGKHGPKFKPSLPTTVSQIRAPRNGVEGVASSMAGLSYLLMRWTDRIVVDETELTGLYDFKLTLNTGSAPQDAISLGSELFSALDEQLGLTLQAKKKAIEVLVVDDADKIPVDN